MMNAFARSLSAANVAKNIRKKVMHIFSLFINCGELETALKFLKRVLYMFVNPQATDAENTLVIIEQCPLSWPAFGINNKIFEGSISIFSSIKFKLIFFRRNVFCHKYVQY